MKDNIPALVQQIKENMFDTTVSPSVRFNYSQTMRSIKDYAEQSLKEYDRIEIKKGR
jgi:hypothetical protein